MLQAGLLVHKAHGVLQAGLPLYKAHGLLQAVLINPRGSWLPAGWTSQQPEQPNTTLTTFMTAVATTVTRPAAACRLDYRLEVMKQGRILEARGVASRDHYTFGRSPGCDLLLEHPSASRLHAVLQFRGRDGAAFLLDAGSAHGTFLNKRRLRPRAHAPLRWVPPPGRRWRRLGASQDAVAWAALRGGAHHGPWGAADCRQTLRTALCVCTSVCAVSRLGAARRGLLLTSGASPLCCWPFGRPGT